LHYLVWFGERVKGYNMACSMGKGLGEMVLPISRREATALNFLQTKQNKNTDFCITFTTHDSTYLFRLSMHGYFSSTNFLRGPLIQCLSHFRIRLRERKEIL
jgi:hypothetical protein